MRKYHGKICVDILGPHIMRGKLQKETLDIKAITMIDPVTGWFEITQYNNKRVISIKT